ncbi:MAG: hypothetical protein DRN16_03610 [Thermoplasmata archaeon]|nr:MAG: hypothetical protein DRN16_03610 [Thermoplasmata archaeon]
MSKNSIDREVVQHLLFYKSLSDDVEDTSRIERYLELMERVESGDFLTVDNPFDKSIALAFELVIQQKLDPWAVDLVKFSSLYLNRAKKEKIDLVVAGKILYMAWKILNMQSYDVMVNAQRMESPSPNEEALSWDDLPFDEWYSDDETYSYTKMVVDKQRLPIVEPVRRKAARRVSLIELVEAFDKARKEAEEYQLLEDLRRKERERILKEARKRMKGTVHEENFERDVERVWKRIQQFNGRSIPITSLCNFEDRNDRITTLLALLHLAQDRKVRVYQRRFPFGRIYVKNVTRGG